MTPTANPLNARPKLENFDISYYEKEYQEYSKALPSASTAAAATAEHSGPQGKVKRLTIIDDPADWRAKDLQPEHYTYRLSVAEVAEIIAATDAILAKGVKDEGDVKKLTRSDYNLPTVGPKFRELAYNNVTAGRGFHLIKGFPVEQYKANRVGLVVAYWGLALVTGRVQISQTDRTAGGTVFGSILNHITPGCWANVHNDPDSFYSKLSRVDAMRLPFHSDQGATDLIAMLSLSAAEEGGESKLASAVYIHNELLRRGRKDLVEVLSTPGIWLTPNKLDQARIMTDEEGRPAGFEETHPFEYHDGYLSVHYEARKYGLQGKGHTPLQKEAIWAVAALADDPEVHLTLKLEPGDIELLHNPSVLHARAEVVDAENRHLLRWWVHSDLNPRPIAPHYAPRSNVGPKGGLLVPDYDDLSKQRLPLYPYSRHDGLGQSLVA